MEGTVKIWMDTKGYGFITVEGDDKGIFVHNSALQGGIKSLKTGQKVKFEVEETPKGKSAKNVTVIS